jgi:hypothetical protein
MLLVRRRGARLSRCGPARSKWRGELCEPLSVASRSSALHWFYDAQKLFLMAKAEHRKAMRGRTAVRKHFVQNPWETASRFSRSFGNAHASSRRFQPERCFK